MIPAILALAFAAGPDALAAKVAALVNAHKGKVAVAVKHLTTGESFAVAGDEPMPTASLIKLPVMAEAYRQAAAGRLRWDDELTLTDADKVPGSGVLTPCFSAGCKVRVRDAVRLMIAVSDNTATNLVLDRLGLDATNHFMADLGLPDTRLHAKVYRASVSSLDKDRSKRFGLGSTTAREMLRLLEMLHAGKLVSADASREMLAVLRTCDDGEKFPLLLPEGVTVAHKTGSVSDARTDAGILEFKGGPVAVCVLTDKNADRRWKPDNAGNRLCAEVARAVYDHYTDPAGK